MASERTVQIDAKPAEDVYRSNVPQDDPVKLILSRAHRAREAAVAVAETLLLQEKVKECYVREGVNHYRNCVEVNKAYLEKLKLPNFMEPKTEE